MVVTPHNSKEKKYVTGDYHRLQMVHLATEDFPKSSLRISSLNYPTEMAQW
jgi:nicotinic acid mononucleotide adenylyltransferase